MGKLNKTLAQFLEKARPAHGLPASTYQSKAFWKKECKTVLHNNWVCIGAAHELTAPGDVVPITLAEQPLLIVRNLMGEIATFHNVCRHRCTTLVEQSGNVGKLIRCPYHAWAYDLDGKLKASPHFGGTNKQDAEGFDKSSNGLVPVRTHVWKDWIFVNPNGEAPAFDEYAASLIEHLEGVDFSKLTPIGTLDFGVIETNWKLIMENFIEPYHVQFVHASTTDQPLSHHYTIIDGNCLGSAVDLDEELGSAGSLGVSSRYLTLYPNFILGRYFPDQLGVYLNIPLGPNQMAQKRYLYTTEDQALSAGEIADLKELWWDVHKEDHEMVERMWRGRTSNIAKDGGVLSPVWEDSVRAFQELIVADVTKSSGAKT